MKCDGERRCILATQTVAHDNGENKLFERFAQGFSTQVGQHKWMARAFPDGHCRGDGLMAGSATLPGHRIPVYADAPWPARRRSAPTCLTRW